MKQHTHVIITGGGRGLGLGMALRYLKRGCNLSILNRVMTPESTEQLDAAAQTGQAQWQFHAIEISEFEQVQAAVQKAVEQFGAPELAINSAGVLINKAFADMLPGDFQRVININLMGSHNFAAAVLPYMQSGSRLALVASVAGLFGNYGYSAYGASKFGVVGLANTLRYEYEPLGIHISCICPPEVETAMVLQERKEGNKVSLDMKALAGTLDTDSACDQIVADLDAGKWIIIPGVNGKLTAWAARYIPAIFDFAMIKLIKRSMRKRGLL